MVKTWRQYCFPYIFGYFTIGQHVYVDLSQLRSIPPPKFFDGIVYSSMSCIFDFFKPTFFLICLMVKSFRKGTLPYISLWKLMLKSLYHTLCPGLLKSIFRQLCVARWALLFFILEQLSISYASWWKHEGNIVFHTFLVILLSEKMFKSIFLNLDPYHHQNFLRELYRARWTVSFTFLNQLSFSYASWWKVFGKVLFHKFYYGYWC